MPGQTIRKWRGVFGISQTDLARCLRLSPSVISDYESGRRKSPGIRTIKKIIEALVEITDKEVIYSIADNAESKFLALNTENPFRCGGPGIGSR